MVNSILAPTAGVLSFLGYFGDTYPIVLFVSPQIRNPNSMYIPLFLYVCMYDQTYSKSMDQPGKVTNFARGQLNRENENFPVRVRA